MQPIRNYIKHPACLGDALVHRFGQWLPDSTYIRLRYRFQMGKKLNLNDPQTFQEKLQWLKLHDRNPEYTKMVDKVKVKEYVAEKVGCQYVIPLLGVWDKAEDIEWDKLPRRFVLKTNHSGGNTGVIICRDKETFDREAAVKKLSASLHSDVYSNLREWPYKNVERKVFAEEFVETIPDVKDLPDYKFFCFGGECKCFKIDFGRSEEHHANYFLRDGSLASFGESTFPPVFEKELDIPDKLNEMIELAESLSRAINNVFSRIDMYYVNGKIYFGEITFFPASGLGAFTSEEWDYKLGEWIELNKIKTAIRWKK